MGATKPAELRESRDITGSMNHNGAFQAEFARDVRTGLCGSDRKWLPAKHLYDSLGTALFEAITHLPEYGLTRADERLLLRCAPALPCHLPDPEIIVAELGSGSGTKTRIVVKSLGAERVRFYCPIDISSDALERCSRDLGRIVAIRAHHGAYVAGVRSLRNARPRGVPLLLLFLGSSIGNFDRSERAALLAELRSELLPGDRLLFGFDLVKPETQLLTAYDDPAGVTAAFNRNVLGRVNRELGADFDLASFGHRARYDERNRRVEMHLVSRRSQQVPIPGVGGICHLGRGETIWTESSYKFSVREIREMMDEAGFAQLEQWIDEEWPLLEGLWTVHD